MTWTRDDYKAIRVWGRMMGSPQATVEQHVDRCVAEQAPPDTVYFDWRKVPVRLSDCHPGTRELVEDIMKGGEDAAPYTL